MLLTDPVTLENAHVRLEPLDVKHAFDLAAASVGMDHVWYTSVPAPGDVPAEIARRLAMRDAGTMNPWAVLRDGVAVGMTTFCAIDQPNRHVEIGYTWLGLSAQRTEVNTAAKLLLLGHAFEECDAIAVELRTHWHNQQSRTAIARLGAKQDGVLRNHRLGPDGTLRDTVVFSILPHEWPAVRLGLQERLRRG
ncbi:MULTISPECIES: GNAT family protein [unclassified Microbacterium]|uniref:GNAT family N-acetyltransferase n=1 Tax=unclassified Microbacterium TaxID=2609290 RepID=UPI00214B3455|nr:MULTISPECIES: GNAT family protein [unclassified Microbacterium]MCR2785183.1 GNAT family N-acetyltransferase [Microbacterium sp. zg.B96]MDL5352545.1 GNAT family protein [Microbacterium sp. zg-YB36]WIM16716.1 GNAT family protein [Microbacterium sp. zg-B96]